MNGLCVLVYIMAQHRGKGNRGLYYHTSWGFLPSWHPHSTQNVSNVRQPQPTKPGTSFHSDHLVHDPLLSWILSKVTVKQIISRSKLQWFYWPFHSQQRYSRTQGPVLHFHQLRFLPPSGLREHAFRAHSHNRGCAQFRHAFQKPLHLRLPQHVARHLQPLSPPVRRMKEYPWPSTLRYVHPMVHHGLI